MGLQCAHFYAQDAFALRRQRSQHITLQPAEHERLELRVKLLNLLFMVGVSEVEFARQCDCQSSSDRQEQTTTLSALHFSGIKKCISESNSVVTVKPDRLLKSDIYSPLTLFCNGVPVISNFEAAENDFKASYS